MPDLSPCWVRKHSQAPVYAKVLVQELEILTTNGGCWCGKDVRAEATMTTLQKEKKRQQTKGLLWCCLTSPEGQEAATGQLGRNNGRG